MLLDQYVNRTDFASFEDFRDHLEIRIPEPFNFGYDIVDEMARRCPDQTALVWCDELGDHATFTFADMKRESDKAANVFRSLGIGKGDPVMLILKRRYQFWFCVVALHKLGAIAIPATHLLTAHDIEYRCNAAGIKAIVAVNDERVLEAIEDAQPTASTLAAKVVMTGARAGWTGFEAAMASASSEFVRPTGEQATTNDDIMLLYFTSGTTGMPKMVLHDFAYPLAHILTAKFWQNVDADGLHLTVADTGWAKAAWGKIYGQWICGAAVFVFDYERFNPKQMMEVVAQYGVTSFCAPPTVYRFLIKEDLTQYDLSALRYCCVAGEPLNPEIFYAFQRMTGHKIMEGFGQTETVVQLATWPWMEPKPGSMGRPCPLYDIDVIRDDGTSCDVGEEGQIVIRTGTGKPAGMFCGYYRNPELVKSVWRDGCYYTGDLAWRDEDGYFWFVGRADDLIKTSGYRVGPFEVESALMEHPAVMECAITGVPDPERGQVIKATIVLTKNYTASDELAKALQEHVKHVTAPYKYPRIIEFVPELPKTISGKIRRVQIRSEDTEKAFDEVTAE